MGQKVNPHGLRVGVIKDWDSKWYAEETFADNLVEDDKIRKCVKKHSLISKFNSDEKADKYQNWIT